MKKFAIFALFIPLIAWSEVQSVNLQSSATLEAKRQQELERQAAERVRLGKRPSPHYYGYFNREFTWGERMEQIGWVYLVTWGVYPLGQWDVVTEEGSFKKYRQNFGKLVFDKDEPFWNWFVHPLTGSQVFLLYRALGHSRPSALGMTFITSTLFELTVEVYTEPASVQDLYQTPILGSVLGYGLEKLSMYLLNTGNPMGKFFGHLLNIPTMLWFYDGKIRVTPVFNFKGMGGLQLTAEF